MTTLTPAERAARFLPEEDFEERARANLAAEIRAAVDAETDRCAKVAHEAAQNLGADEGEADELAAAIRSRK